MINVANSNYDYTRMAASVDCGWIGRKQQMRICPILLYAIYQCNECHCSVVSISIEKNFRLAVSQTFAMRLIASRGHRRIEWCISLRRCNWRVQFRFFFFLPCRNGNNYNRNRWKFLFHRSTVTRPTRRALGDTHDRSLRAQLIYMVRVYFSYFLLSLFYYCYVAMWSCSL